MKKHYFSQIATWVKSNLGLCLWIPIAISKGTLYEPSKDYDRDPKTSVKISTLKMFHFQNAPDVFQIDLRKHVVVQDRRSCFA